MTAPFDTRWYHDHRPDAPELPTFDRTGALALLVGNTRRLWPHFLEALADEPHRLQSPDPLDNWIESRIRQALESVDVDHHVVWGHRPLRGNDFIPLQSVAEAAGLAHVSPSHLAIHPTYGPWLAFRAVVIFDRDGPGGESPEPEPRPCDCEGNCRDALDRALEGDDTDDEAWRRWVAVRDACPVGDDYRYSKDQIRYHYDKDRGFLAECVDQWQSMSQ